MNSLAKPSHDSLRQMIAQGKAAEGSQDWGTAAACFLAVSQATGKTHHAARHVQALLRNERHEDALRACATLPGLQGPEATERRLDLEVRAYVAMADFRRAIDMLHSVDTARIPVGLVRLVATRMLQAGASSHADAVLDLFGVIGNGLDRRFFEAKFDLAQGHTERAAAQFTTLQDIGDTRLSRLAGIELARIAHRRIDTEVRAHVANGEPDRAVDKLLSVDNAQIPVGLVRLVATRMLQAGALNRADAVLDLFDVIGNGLDRSFFEAKFDLAQGHTERAAAQFTTLQDIGDTRISRLAGIELARIAHRSGDRAKASRLWAKILQTDPHHLEALRAMIGDSITQGEQRQAEALLEDARRGLAPLEACVLEAKIFGFTPEVIERLEMVAQATPDDPEPRILLAEFHIQNGNMKHAEALLNDGLRRWPDHLRLNQARLVWLEASNAPLKERLQQAQANLKIAPADERILQSVGQLLTHLGRRAEALRLYLAATEKQNTSQEIWRKACQLLIDESRFDEAVSLAGKLREKTGLKTPEDITRTADAYLAARRPDIALDLLQPLIADNTTFEPALRLAAEIEFIEGRDVRARRIFSQIDRTEHAKRKSSIADGYAKCMAAAAIPLSDGPEDAPHNLFPERLLHHLARTKMPELSPKCRAIFHVGSNLAAGGAERQLSYALEAMNRSSDTDRAPRLVVRGLDRDLGHDFYLKDVLAANTDLTVMQDMKSSGKVRDILARHPQTAQMVRAIAASSSELSDVTMPLLAHFLATRPRIVHLWQDAICVSGGIAAMAAGVPGIVLSYRNTIPVEVQRSRRYLREAFLALKTYRGVVRMINNSQQGAVDYETWLDMPSDSIGVIHNGYDFARITSRSKLDAPQQIRSRLGIPEDALVVGSVARFAWEKRPDLWVDTLAEMIHRDARVYGIMIGDGPRWQQCLEQVADYGLEDRIKLVGRKNPVEPWMRALDLLFLSSCREGLPNVLIEAQSLAVPVAAMRAGGSEEALPGSGSSLLLDEGSPAELASAILTVLGDKAWRASAGLNACNFVRKKFSLDTSRAALMRLYDDMDREIDSLPRKVPP